MFETVDSALILYWFSIDSEVTLNWLTACNNLCCTLYATITRTRKTVIFGSVTLLQFWLQSLKHFKITMFHAILTRFLRFNLFKGRKSILKVRLYLTNICYDSFPVTLTFISRAIIMIVITYVTWRYSEWFSNPGDLLNSSGSYLFLKIVHISRAVLFWK